MKNKGMSLVEVIVALVVLSFLAAYLLMPLEVGFMNADKRNQNQQATYLSQERTFFILAQKQETPQAFTSLVNPCPSAPFCTVPSGFSVSSTITNTFSSNYFKLITTTVSGIGNAKTQLIVSHHAAQ